MEACLKNLIELYEPAEWSVCNFGCLCHQAEEKQCFSNITLKVVCAVSVLQKEIIIFNVLKHKNTTNKLILQRK
jgi:hypothetical protein